MIRRLRSLLRHLRAGHRLGCETCASVWARFDTPEFRQRTREALTDFDAGRWYRLDGTPNPDWPKDGPQPVHRTTNARPNTVYIDSVDAARREGRL